MTSLEERIRRAVREDIVIVPYDPQWPELFRQERDHLRSCLPSGLIGRIEHFGSTAVPALSAKPIVDMLVEVTDLEATKTRIVPILESQGYDYFWRPTAGNDAPPFYAWFIKRNRAGVRTHHIHMVERSFQEHWERLLFRDYLIAHPDVALEYAQPQEPFGGRYPKPGGVHSGEDRVHCGSYEFRPNFSQHSYPLTLDVQLTPG